MMTNMKELMPKMHAIATSRITHDLEIPRDSEFTRNAKKINMVVDSNWYQLQAAIRHNVPAIAYKAQYGVQIKNKEIGPYFQNQS